MKKRKMLITILFLMAICLLLSGCEKIREGEIYKKEFLEENTQVYMMPIIHSDGKTSYTTFMPVTYHYPDRWKIYIRSLNKDKQGEYKKAIYYTNEDVYNQCEIGNIFSYEEGRDSEEEPVDKQKH